MRILRATAWQTLREQNRLKKLPRALQSSEHSEKRLELIARLLERVIAIAPKRIHERFRTPSGSVQSSGMSRSQSSDRRTQEAATSYLLNRSQRVEHQHAELRARLEGERQLRIFAAQIVGAAQVAPVIGEAIERFAQASAFASGAALAASHTLEARGDISMARLCLNPKRTLLGSRV
ncbi:MAG TPA: hypothetical protein VEY94_12840 [Patescibacteria group bacterium]|nr:hypothetical protein [Patescibacteria group bacterium]